MNPVDLTLTGDEVEPMPVALTGDGTEYELGLSVSGPFLYVEQDGIFRGKLSLLDASTYELKVLVMGGSLIVQQNAELRGTLSLQDAPEPAARPILVADGPDS